MSIDITTLALAKEYTNRMVGSGGTGSGVNGKDGITPHIGDNGNWFIGTVDTGISAQGPAGENGVTPHIGTNGNWYIGSVNTGVSAKGVKGDNGLDGNGIKSAILNSDYTLTLTFDNGTTYTTPSIRGATGDAGSAGKNGTDGKDGSDGVGIASIKQTTTSTADGGNNVFTVTLTNGTIATFTVKNGSKGSTGKDGSNGVDGGHYTPVVTQPTTDTMQISFAPSKSDMPAVDPVTVNLPVSENSGQNVDLTGYAKEAWVQEGFQPKGGYLTEVPEGYAKTKDIPTKPEDIGAQPAGNYASPDDIPEVPNWAMQASKPAYTASEVGADPKGTAASAVSEHNASGNAHTDLRLEIQTIREQLTAFLDVDEETLNELSELIARIVANQTSIEQLTTGKVNVTDIIDNLTTNVANKPLSAAQGVVIKTLIDGLASGKLDASKLTEAINTALAQAKANGEFDGADGQRGLSLLTVTTEPSSYTTAVGGITPKYRMAISTIKSQAGVTEVLLGDVIKYSYYQYRVDYLDASYAYFTTRVSLRGTAGTSVTIASISESTEDGGSNIVTFSDDKTLTVKNGLRGGRGKSAYEHARDGGYTGTESEFEADLIREVPAITQDMGNSEKLVMSQAAVTNAFNSIAALPYGGSKEWLEANGDRTKLYQIDGYVWGYIESNGWTKSSAQFLVVSKTSDMVNAGGTEYLLRNGSNGTVFSYTEASGDVGVPVYSTLPTTAKAGDIVAVGGRKYKASVTQQQVPNWTKNYANPSDADWGTDKRIGSDGTFRDCAGSIVTNFIPITAGDVVRVKGLDLVNKIESVNAHYMGVYNSDKTIISVANLSTQTMYFSEITETTTGGQATLKSDTQIKYARFGGKPNSTANDIIVTINEEITYRTESTVKWTDIGEYITPVEAGWNATDRTYSVIDSLTATATSGSSAVYSVDGYVYSYISCADWASISKYTPQSIHIDNVLSDTSANTVQNKVVTAELDSIKEDVQENTNDIITLQNAVESLGAASTSSSLTIPSYWESTVTSKTETVKALQVAGGRNCVCFTWASDTHIPDNHNTRTNDIGKVMAKVMDNCNIPFAVLTGDVNTRGSYAEESGLIDCQNQMPIHLAPLWGTERLLMSMGNHDGAWGDSSGYYRKQQSPEKMWEVFFRIQALDFRRVFSNDGLYFYVDNIAQKTRFIILNSHFAGDYAVDSNGWAVNNRFSTAAYGQEQLDWLADEALNLPDGYGAVLFAHTPPEADYPSDASQLIGIVNAYNNKTAFNKSYTSGVDGWNNSTIDVNFASAKGEIIAMFAGHVHWDKVITTTMACPLITILSAGAPANAHQMEEGAVEPTRTPGTATETSFDVVTINRATRTIHCTRVGGGSDRVIPY